MAFIKNQVIADAARAELKDKLVFARLAGTVVEDVDLKGLGSGDTKKFTEFELTNMDLQVLAKGDSIFTDEIGQSSFDVTIEQLAFGKKFYDQDLKYSLSGNSIESESVRHISMAFAQGLDNLALATATNSGRVVDASAGLTSNLILDEAVKDFGENTFDGALAAMIVHPTKAGQFRNDPNFVPVSAYGYENAQFGKQEVGMIGNVPVVMANRTIAAATAGQYKNILVPKNAVLSLIGSELSVENERFSKQRMSEITADIFTGFASNPNVKGIVFEG
ncbi:hypothetical protein FZC84_21230 [Rossellomorea vietnamensis]|uniref:Major capsid protein n=1 Tax=Rossellomorea vietnamensis TaxID=218284 RepID=A0A5D4M2L6_9BACI|nr:hypothetical protein [Rossellomorea vietnamensis]TYR95717.1 hypothetical protein FZC84_21230 [Rossellomorea vietnamensis]